MMMDITGYGLRLVPDRDKNTRELEISYIENVLGLKKEGDVALVVRINAAGLSRLAHLEIKKKEDS